MGKQEVLGSLSATYQEVIGLCQAVQGKLADELRQKGVAPALVEDALAEVADDDEYQAALDLAERKMASLSRHEVAVQRRRLAGMLERRGFGIGLIHRVLRDVLEG